MKHINKVNTDIKISSLKTDFGFPDYCPHEYPCLNCGRKLRLYMKRVLYCRRCHKGKLHPRYNFVKDRIE